MSEPRPFTLTMAMVRSLTALEMARANVLGGLSERERVRITALADRIEDAAPEDALTVWTLLYAYAYQWLRRTEPELTWAEAQTFAVVPDFAQTDELAEASERASVQAAVLTGLPPSEAGNLTQTQLDEYRAIATAREKAIKSAGRRRRSA